MSVWERWMRNLGTETLTYLTASDPRRWPLDPLSLEGQCRSLDDGKEEAFLCGSVCVSRRQPERPVVAAKV